MGREDSGEGRKGRGGYKNRGRGFAPWAQEGTPPGGCLHPSRGMEGPGNAYTVSGKNVAQLATVGLLVNGDIRFMELFNGITEREASNQ